MRNTHELTLTFGERLAKARRLANLNQTEVAERLGIGRRSVVRYEDDTLTPNHAICIAWSVITDVPLEWIETGAVTDPATLWYRAVLADQLPLFPAAA